MTRTVLVKVGNDTAHFKFWPSKNETRTLVIYSHGMQHPSKTVPEEALKKNYAFVIPYGRPLSNPPFSAIEDGAENVHRFAQFFIANAQQCNCHPPKLYIYPYLYEQSPSIKKSLKRLSTLDDGCSNYDLMYFINLDPENVRNQFIMFHDLMTATHPDGGTFSTRYDSILILACRSDAGVNGERVGMGSGSSEGAIPNGLYTSDDSVFLSIGS